MDEFLNVLKLRLMDRLPPAELAEQITMYENYIKEQIADGKTREQVMRKLGDPAKVADMVAEHYADPALRGEKGTATDTTHTAGASAINARINNPERGIRAEFREDEGWDVRLGKLKINTWYGTLIILGIVLALFVLFHELTR